MAFIDTISPAEASGETRDMYARQQETYGYVPNYAKAFGHRPEVMVRWGRLLAEIRRPMDDRLFELATLAAALELKNTACSLAHGQQLARFIGEDGVQSLAKGDANNVITDAEAAVVAFASKAARDASSIEKQDVNSLKQQGYSDAEIFDIATTVAGRSFLTKILDALGVEADVTALEMNEVFRDALSVGRPICRDAVEVL